METRKTQLTGGSTFTVSLPKEWAEENHIETGDTLRLYPRGRTLIIEPSTGGDAYWETTVEIDQYSNTQVRRTVQALYTAGFNRFTLSSSIDLETNQRAIAAAARQLIGLETIESTEQQITLQSLLNSATVSVEQSTIQLQQVALSMQEDAVTALLNRDKELADHVIERDNQVDRLYAMISRHFQRSLVSLQETEKLDLDQADLYVYQTTARQLERVGDHAEKIADLASQFQNPPPSAFAKEIASNAEAARNIVNQATSTIVGDADIDTAHTVLDNRDALTEELQALERELHDQDVPEGHLIALTLDSLQRTGEYGGNIAETALQTAARERQL